jgi:hypothetical protein
LTDDVDTGFDDVLAGGAVWEAPVEVLAASPSVAAEQAPITVAVTEDPGLSPEAIQATKSLIQLPVLTPSELAHLARDFAMDVKEHHVILKNHNLTAAQYDFLLAHSVFYKQAYHAACIEWHAPLNTQDRIKVEAAAILEDSLLGLGARMQNKVEGLPGVIEAAKLFAKISGVGEREAGNSPPGERFVINIDLGGGKTLTASTTPVVQVDQAAVVQLQIPGGA